MRRQEHPPRHRRQHGAGRGPLDAAARASICRRRRGPRAGRRRPRFCVDQQGSSMQSDISASVRKFINDNFLFREGLEAIADDASFLDAGIIDSTGVLELVSYLEDTWGITVADDEMLPENFHSIRRLVPYLQRNPP